MAETRVDGVLNREDVAVADGACMDGRTCMDGGTPADGKTPVRDRNTGDIGLQSRAAPSSAADANRDVKDLERIFQEKLFVRRRTDNEENISPDNANRDVSLVDRHVPHGRPLADRPLNIPTYHKRHDSSRIPNEVSLKGIYQLDEDNKDGINMNDVYRTRELLVSRNSADVSSITDAKNGLDVASSPGLSKETKNGADLNMDAVDSKNAVRKIEEEFNRFKSAQLEALKLKSKVYRFIHSEIFRIDQKYSESVKRLEDENRELKLAVADVDAKYRRYKDSVNVHLNRSIEKFKARVLAAMKEYKKKCDHR